MPISSAIESIFANAQQNAASLIETATLAINAKVNTIEEAEVMIQELSSEAVKYNELLTTIMNAMRQVESGDMNKEEAACIIIPAVKELKDKCTALKIANVEAPGDDITEDEIAILRELIIGAKAAAEDRLVAIRLGDDEREDPELAMEAGFLAAEYVNTQEVKTANELYINSKKLYSLGEKEKALIYIKKAKSLYEKALKNLLNSGKFAKTETIVKHANITNRSTAITTDKMTFNITRTKLEHHIDRCTAHILQWENTVPNKSYQELLDEITSERKHKSAKKAAKKTKHYESEDNNMDIFGSAKAAKGELNVNSANEGFVDEFNYDEFMFACEAYMDDMMAAMESDEDGTDDEAPSKKAGKIRSLFSKISRAFKRGNKEEVEALKKEADAAVKDLADAEANAPEEQKSKYRKAAKTAAIAVGATAAVVGLTMAGTAIVQKAKGSEIDPTTLFKIAGNVTHGAVQNIGDAAASRRVGRAEMKNENVSVNDAMRANRYFEHQALKHEQKVAKADRKETKKYNKMKMAQKEAAKKIAKASTDAFGISEFDLYEVILEAMCSEDCFDYDSDVELADAIEAML